MTTQAIIHDVMILRTKSQKASQADLKIAEDLKDTLIENKNIAAGLAANMIGENKRIIAFFVGPFPMLMLNPKIIAKKESYITEEGCLSLTGVRPAKRYKIISVEYEDTSFNKKIQEFTDFTAEVIQHEIDHCDGILI